MPDTLLALVSAFARLACVQRSLAALRICAPIQSSCPKLRRSSSGHPADLFRLSALVGRRRCQQLSDINATKGKAVRSHIM